MSESSEPNDEPGSADLMQRFDNMQAAEEAEQDARLPTLARQRQNEAIEKAQAVYRAARELMADGMLQAAGYRVLVKPIEGTDKLEAAEADVAPHLADKGFQVKSDAEMKREERGENHGVVIHIGPIAFDRLGGRAAWCDEGEVVVFSRYAGTRVEHPRGSGTFYQLMNDEDIFGKVI